MSDHEARRTPNPPHGALAVLDIDGHAVFAAPLGLPGAGVFRGDDQPPAFGDPTAPWNEDDERRRRDEDALRRWDRAYGDDAGRA